VTAAFQCQAARSARHQIERCNSNRNRFPFTADRRQGFAVGPPPHSLFRLCRCCNNLAGISSPHFLHSSTGGGRPTADSSGRTPLDFDGSINQMHNDGCGLVLFRGCQRCPYGVAMNIKWRSRTSISFRVSVASHSQHSNVWTLSELGRLFRVTSEPQRGRLFVRNSAFRLTEFPPLLDLPSSARRLNSKGWLRERPASRVQSRCFFGMSLRPCFDSDRSDGGFIRLVYFALSPSGSTTVSIRKEKRIARNENAKFSWNLSEVGTARLPTSWFKRAFDDKFSRTRIAYISYKVAADRYPEQNGSSGRRRTNRHGDEWLDRQ